MPHDGQEIYPLVANTLSLTSSSLEHPTPNPSPSRGGKFGRAGFERFRPKVRGYGVRGFARWARPVWLGAVLAALAPAAQAEQPAPAEILVSVVATRGSPHQPFGAEVLGGAEAAAASLNAAGGVLGQKVRVVGWSEDCTRQRAQQIAEEVARLKPALVIGHLCAGAALAAAPTYARAGVLLIVPGVRHPQLTASPGAGPLVLRLAGRDDQFARETVRFIASRYPEQRVAIIADRTQQARALGASVSAELQRQKVGLAHDERFESGEKSYAGLAERVRTSGAGVVVMPAQPVELGVVVAGLRRAGVDATLIGSEILAVPEIEATARQEAARLVLMLPWTGLERGPDADHPPRVPNPAREPNPDSISGLAVQARAAAALQAWAAAVGRAGTTDAVPVAAALRSEAVGTAVGPLAFDAQGDALVPSYVAHSWRDGGWRPIGR